jgi:hypothetical protein
MTKAFDLASFVPAAAPSVGATVKVTALGPPEVTAWTPAFVEAPSDAKLYARSNAAWVADAIQTDAPADGKSYLRSNNAWAVATTTGVTEAPQDGKTYGRLNAAWVATLPLSGGVMTGMLTLAGPPSNPLDAATKAYTDTAVSVIDAGTY